MNFFYSLIKSFKRWVCSYEFNADFLKQTWDIKKILKEGSMWYIIIALAFFLGYYLASQRYEALCNQIIYDMQHPNAYNLINASGFFS